MDKSIISNKKCIIPSYDKVRIGFGCGFKPVANVVVSRASVPLVRCGLCNAPSTFQRLMEAVLRDLNWNSCLIYLDDVIVFSDTFDNHLIHLKQVFDRFREANIRLKPSKCSFGRQEVHYLGHIVSSQGVLPDPTKIQAVKEYPVPRTIRQVRGFLGLANYYRRFVQDFSCIAAPLHSLTKKGSKFEWDENCQKSFEALKTRLISAPILGFPDFTSPFYLCVDASGEGIGAILEQRPEGPPVVIAYGGRKLTPQEQNYSATEREALAVIDAVKRYRTYLFGRHFYIVTDHHSLRWLMNIREPTGRLARWALEIQQYDFDIIHRPGLSHGNADAMSRYPYDSLCEVTPTSAAFSTPGFQSDDLLELQRADDQIAPMIQYLEEGILPSDDKTARTILLTQDQYHISDDGLLYHIWKPTGRGADKLRLQLVVPPSLRESLLFQMHDEVTAGHLGTFKTYEKLRQRYYWINMYADCEHWVRSCVDCATKKNPKGVHKAPLLPIPVEGAFDRLGIDCLGPFPVTYSNNKYIVAMTDYLTKWPEAFAVPNIEASTIAEILVDQVITRHGAPRTLLSDRGSNFLSKLVLEVCKLINTNKANTTAYHPQTDGLVERFNGTLAQSLSMYTSTNQTDWDVYIPAVLFGYRVSPHSSTGETPFYLLYGREPRLPVDVVLTPPKDLSASVLKHRENIVTRLQSATAIAQENIAKAQQQMKAYYDLRAKDPQFLIGDRIWVYTPSVPEGLTKKLRHLWHGPYRIVEELSPAHFQLATCDNRRITTKVHANRMKLFYDRADRPLVPPVDDAPLDSYLLPVDLPDDSFIAPKDPPQAVTATTADTEQRKAPEVPHRPLDPAPTVVAPAVLDDVYSVERIISSRNYRGKVQYLVKWAGYPCSANTWEPEENILDHRLIENFQIKENILVTAPVL